MDLREEFKKEMKLSFKNIPINGVHMEYIKWLENKLSKLHQPTVISTFCKCKGGAVGRTVTADFEHQICDRCGNIAK